MNKWFERPLDPRAPAGGEIGVDGHFYRGGEIMPYYVPRDAMPQIDDINHFTNWLTQNNINFQRTIVKPSTCIFRQRVICDPTRIRGDYIHLPIITSREPVVIDGNHRCTRAVMERIETLEAIKIYLVFENAVKVAFKYPGTRVATHIKKGE